MTTIWMGIATGPRETRVIATHGANETILKARLLRDPAHPRALPWLLEAVALWQGLPVRAALAADDTSNGCDTSLHHDTFPDFGRSPLYSLDWIPVESRTRGRRDLSGMGDFADLRQLLLAEVAR
jgi:hypothetical protein